MGNSAILTVKIIADASKASGEMDRAAQRMGKAGDFARKAAVPAAALGTALLLGAKRAVDAASKTQQAMGGVDAVFGKNAKTVKAWAADAADSIGLSKSQYGELATIIGSQLKGTGMSMDQVTKKTGSLIGLGGDLAAMYGGTTADAVAALSSALKGEFDPMDKYAVKLSETAIKAEMVARGTDKLTGKNLDAAKTQATLALLTQKTADAHGAAAREYDTAAQAQGRLTAKTENLMSSMGEILLPIVTQLADMFSKLANFASKNTTAFQILVGVIGTIVVAVLALNAAMSVYNTVTAASAAIQKAQKSSLVATRVQLMLLNVQQKLVTAWNWLMAVGFKAAWRAATGPVGLVITAIMLVVAGFILLYRKSETFRRIVDAVWKAVKIGAKAAATVVKRVWEVVWRAVSAYVRAYLQVIRFVFGIIRTVSSRVASVVRSVFRAAWSSVSSLARSAMSGIRSAISAVLRTATSVANSIRSRLGGIWSSIASAARRAMSGLAALFSPITRAINAVIRAVQSLIGWLGRIRIPRISLPHIPGFNAASTTVAQPATGFRASSMTTGTQSTGQGATVINVSGALDPEAVARQIQRILSGHSRRVGLRSA